MSHPQFYCKIFTLRHAWLNLWDKHMTTGRINQVSCIFRNCDKLLYYTTDKTFLHHTSWDLFSYSTLIWPNYSRYAIKAAKTAKPKHPSHFLRYQMKECIHCIPEVLFVRCNTQSQVNIITFDKWVNLDVLNLYNWVI